MTYTIAVCTVKKTPDDGQRNCPKHVEFYSKNKFYKLVHLVGFITRIYHDALSPERQTVINWSLHHSISFSMPVSFKRKNIFLKTQFNVTITCLL